MEKLLRLLLILLLIGTTVYGQYDRGVNLNTVSGEFHLYKITPEQSLALATVPGKQPDTAYFKSPFLVLPADSPVPVLPQGHYLRVSAAATTLNYSYFFITDYNIYILDNSTDLLIQLRDKQSDSIIHDVRIHVGDRQIPFDPELKAYRIARSYDQGRLQVVSRSDTFYYNLRRTYDKPRHGNSIVRLLYRKPFRYVVIPVYMKEHLPVDAYESIRNLRPYGVIHTLMNAGNKLFRKNRNDYGYGTYEPYFFFSKPKYRAGDTIRFHVLIRNRQTGAWLYEPLTASLNTGYKQIILDTLIPAVAGGGYHFAFRPVDSFNMKLDRRYAISLTDKHGTNLTSSEFYYEEYELEKAVFRIKGPDKNEHIKGKPFALEFTAKDENGLPMPDTKAEVYICRSGMGAIGPSRLFVPDTIASFSFDVMEGTKKFAVNDSIFPDADMSYRIFAAMRNSAFEKINTTYDVSYTRKKTALNMSAVGDQLRIDMLQNDTAATGNARLQAFDVFNNLMEDTVITLPYKTTLNTHVWRYVCNVNDIPAQTFSGDQVPAQLDVRLARDAGQIALDVVNPRNLQFTWQLYKTNKELERGQGRTLSRTIEARDKEKYYIQLQYVWAGKAAQLTYEIPLQDKLVKLTVDQPGTIYPGKETEITITARDYRNRPVKGMSIFSYGLTAKFDDIYEPRLSYFGKAQKSKTVVNTFKVENVAKYGDMILNYPMWRKKMQLESIYAYRFLYPSDTPEIVTVPTDDSSTQIAPFIMSDGKLQPVRYVMLDRKPVYFGFTDVRMPYSFLIPDTNYHQLAVQTDGDYIFIDSLKLQPHMKSIFSIDLNHLPHNAHRRKGNDYMDFSNYIFSYNTAGAEGRMNYMENRYDPDELYILPSNNANDYRGMTIGPVHGYQWLIAEHGVYEQEITLERSFTYQVQQNLIKMIRNGQDNYPQRSTLPPLHEFALRPTLLREQIRNSLNTPYEPFSYFASEENGDQYISIDMQPLSGDKLPADLQPLYYVLLAKDRPGFARISAHPFQGNVILPAGMYELAAICRDHTCYSAGTFTPVRKGFSYFRTEALTPVVNRQLEILDGILRPASGDTSNVATMQRLFNHFQQYTGHKEIMITGTVKNQLGMPLANAQVDIEGGDYRKSASTDYYGRFSMQLSPEEFRKERLKVRYYRNRGSRQVVALAGIKPGLQLTVILDMNKEVQEPYHSVASGNDGTGLPEGSQYYNAEDIDVAIYGQKVDKRTYTGSVATVTREEIEQSPLMDVSVAMQESVAGISVSSGSGQPGASPQILLRGNGSLSAGNGPLIVLDGALYSGRLQSIDPSYIESMVTLKNAEATGLYGARGADGVIVITTKKGITLPAAITALTQPVDLLPEIPEDIMVSGLRNHFSDEAFWQPGLVTDKHGQVRFKVKFPDDATSWKTFVYATDNHQRTGQSAGIIRAFKPLTASLALPHFVVAGDEVHIQGKSVQYGKDSVQITTAFYKNDTLVTQREHTLGAYVLDSFRLHQEHGDSVKVKYLLQKGDGYFDGEEKNIPVVRKGTGIAAGAFLCLDSRDTVITVPVLNKDTLHIAATASLIDVVVAEVQLLKEYKYLCNEQLSSKILATLTQQRLYEALHRPFSATDRKFVQDMVDLLSKRQQGQQLWGWWSDGAPVLWISAHVVHALAEAGKMSYRVSVDYSGITRPLIRNFEADSNYTDLDALQLIHAAGVKIDFAKYTGRYERKHPSLTLADKLRLTRLRQEFGLKANTDFLQAYSNTDIFGNIYWKDTMQYVYQNEIISTVNALQILSADSNNQTVKPQKVVNWLLQQRKPYGWRNTYESALIIEALAKYVPLGDSLALKPVLDFSGGLNETVRTFPFERALVQPAPITVHKTGAAPVYFTYYQRKWDTSETASGNAFRVSSAFMDRGKAVNQLAAGKPVQLKVKVKVEKDAEFVMIEVPIPAACSYSSKTGYNYGNEIHREYFNDHVSIFCQQLPKGEYEYSIELLPKYTGTYTLNPAKAELMYFPVFYGKEGLRKITVE